MSSEHLFNSVDSFLSAKIKLQEPRISWRTNWKSCSRIIFPWLASHPLAQSLGTIRKIHLTICSILYQICGPMCYEETRLTDCLNWRKIVFVWYEKRKKVEECNNCISRESMLVYQLGFGRCLSFCVRDKILILSFFVQLYIFDIFSVLKRTSTNLLQYILLFFHIVEQHYFIIK